MKIIIATLVSLLVAFALTLAAGSLSKSEAVILDASRLAHNDIQSKQPPAAYQGNLFYDFRQAYLKLEEEYHVIMILEFCAIVGILILFFWLLKTNKKLRKSRAELKLALRKVATANDAKGAFLANMSHDLRTPLNAIIGFSSLLTIMKADNDDATKTVKEYAESINQSGEQLLQLIDSLFQLADIESFSKIEAMEERSLDELCADVSSHFGVNLDWLNIKLLGSAQGVCLVGEWDLLKQAIINLIVNARVHNSSNTKVTFRLRADERHIRLTIMDNGQGMSSEQLTSANAYFAKTGLAQAYRSDTAQCGMGINIAQAIIKRHQGTIRFSASQGAGTIVTILLPIVNYKKDGVNDNQATPQSSKFTMDMHKRQKAS